LPDDHSITSVCSISSDATFFFSYCNISSIQQKHTAYLLVLLSGLSPTQNMDEKDVAVFPFFIKKNGMRKKKMLISCLRYNQVNNYA
jgi:hypothetical protein